MASEPYCAEAPSLKISTLSIASGTMKLISVAFAADPVCEPAKSAEVCLLLPFISTNIWFGARPRSVGGSTADERSPPWERKALKEGAEATSICARSICGILIACSFILITSTGAVVSNLVLPLLREPITIVSVNISAASGRVTVILVLPPMRISLFA